MTDEAKQAIAILQKEILCVSRDCDTSRCEHCDLVMPDREPIIRAFRMAINALHREQQFLEAGYKNGRVEFNIGGRKFMVKEMAQ